MENMSAKARSLQRLYGAGRISTEGLQAAVDDGVLTEEEAAVILEQ